MKYVHLTSYEPENFGEKKCKPNRSTKIAAIVLSAAILSGAAGFGGGIAAVKLSETNREANVSVNASPVSYTNSTSFNAVSTADMCIDSVVEIRTESVKNSSRMGQFVSQGAGSGVIVSSDGYIATNNHVISGATKITVKLTNSKEYSAELIGTDQKTDLAVLKISETGLKPATFGTSSTLKVGESVLAIGNPLGELGGTVTSGIISALDRQIEIDNEKMTLLQTDAAVNPGNSGGGLFDSNGLLIGIVNAKSSGSDVEGLAFAIPIDTAKDVINQIKENGYVSGRVQLGISVSQRQSSYNFFTGEWKEGGLYIAEVFSNTNASKAGLKSGDLIVSVNDKAISSYSDLKSLLDECSVSDAMTFVVSRNGQRHTLSFTLQEARTRTTDSASLY